ncbi:sensor histidine kinase [Herbiconiux sp. VKM Ac-2851]|uniref:sensor histidine kinase n=1 Tax=Herbiconiux sp. VKM Ac-2851 TaxID=2739025 RepID=UPI001565E999|nr:histidine kinase [Herbiconiux sp. VKM Ac-2851]NQX33570.1 ATPase [Herbiconiux sp. VKM Ac-2851]
MRRDGTPRPAPVRPAPLRAALLLIALFALVLGVVQLVVGAAPGVPGWVIPVFTLLFWTWAVAGIAAWWRRPTSFLGALLLLGSLALFAAGVGNLGHPLLEAIAAVFATTLLAVTVHLLLAFPTGRLRGRVPVVTVVLGYVNSIVLQAPLFLLPPDEETLLGVVSTMQSLLGLVVVVTAAVLLVGRLRSADPRNRRVLLPLNLYGILAVLLIPVSGSLLPLFGADPVGVVAAQLAITGGIPIAFLIGVLAGGFSPTVEADALSTWLGTAGSPRSAVEQALARSLGDDSLRVSYWSEAQGVLVDAAGNELGGPGGSRLREEVRVEARLVGAIDYDGRMVADTEAVRRAGRVLAVALDRERLTAELSTSNAELGLSRVRLVEAADRERARIARDLHDGLQVQLVLLALEAQQLADAEGTPASTAAAATGLRQRIDDAAADLRHLVHAVLPSALIERGLTAAAEDLIDRLDIPGTLVGDVDDAALPPATARTAYLIVAESLSNAVKHAAARSVEVRLRMRSDTLEIVVVDDGAGGARIAEGGGLKGLADRVDALGGSFELTSAPGAGTRVRAELPCGS